MLVERSCQQGLVSFFAFQSNAEKAAFENSADRARNHGFAAQWSERPLNAGAAGIFNPPAEQEIDAAVV